MFILLHHSQLSSFVAPPGMTVNSPSRIPSRRGSRVPTMVGSTRERPMYMAGRADMEDRLVVAVDFGTTFSGVATVYSANPDDLDVIKASQQKKCIGCEASEANLGHCRAGQVAMESLATRCRLRSRTSPSPSRTTSHRNRHQCRKRSQTSSGGSSTNLRSLACDVSSSFWTAIRSCLISFLL